MGGKPCLFIAEFGPDLPQRSQFSLFHNLIIGTPGKVALTSLVVPPQEIALPITRDLIGGMENQFGIGGMEAILDQDDD